MRTVFDMLSDERSPCPARRGPARPRSVRLRTALALVLLAAPAAATVGAVGAVAATSTAAEAPRTWVVDAVDDTAGNRWESVDTGTSVVTIAVGDTVEWQFDRATQGHDLVSLAPSQPWETVWPTALQEYRDAGGPSVTYTFDQPGTYRYECSLHGTTMTGTVVVVPADGDQPAAHRRPRRRAADRPGAAGRARDRQRADPDGDVVSVAWDFGDGGAPTYTDHAMLEYTHARDVRRPAPRQRRARRPPRRGVPGHRHRRPARPAPTRRRDGALPAIDALGRAGAGHGAARGGVLDAGHHPR